MATDLFPMTSNRMYLNRSLKAFSSALSLVSSLEEELEQGFSGLYILCNMIGGSALLQRLYPCW